MRLRHGVAGENEIGVRCVDCLCVRLLHVGVIDRQHLGLVRSPRHPTKKAQAPQKDEDMDGSGEKSHRFDGHRSAERKFCH